MAGSLEAQNQPVIEKTNQPYPSLVESQEEMTTTEYILFIGCSDFRIDPKRIVGEDKKIFVYRNIANIVSDGDPSMQAVLEFVVGNPHTKEVIVCGHTDCKGVALAEDDKWHGEVLERWLVPLRNLRHEPGPKLLLHDLNVLAGVKAVKRNKVVKEAMAEGRLKVSGLTVKVSMPGQFELLEC
jgi:carbonic anhydrase